MMNDFCTASSVEKSAASLTCILHFNAAHPIFEGHFPGNPIVPGVCTMAIVKELLEKATNQKLILKESKGIKFLGLINPSMSPHLSISWKEESARIAISASLQDGTTTLFKMSGTYIPAIR